MNKIEPIKRLAEKATGLGIPTREEALTCVVDVRALRMKFRDDGYVPNNPILPLLYYRKAIRLGRKHDPAAVLETIFNAHGWGGAWRNGIYFYVHYHSKIHEALGIARGSATVRLGGNKGKTVRVTAGDLIVIPAGTGHECIKASTDFLVVGAYPAQGTYNECRGTFQEHDKAVTSIRRVPIPKQNPVSGKLSDPWQD